MKHAIAAMLTAVLMLAGCTPAPLDTRAACDAAGPVMRTFGAEPPTIQRYVAAAADVRAISDRADHQAQQALAPLLDALDAGAASADLAATMKLASASITLLGVCAAAGSTGYTPATPSATPTPKAATVSGLLRVEGDWEANIDADNTTIDGPCLVAAGYDDIAEGRSVTIRDGEGAVVGMGELMNPRLAIEDGRDEMTATFCEFSFSVEAVPQGRKFYGVEVGNRGEVDFPEADLFDEPVLVLGDLP